MKKFKIKKEKYTTTLASLIITKEQYLELKEEDVVSLVNDFLNQMNAPLTLLPDGLVITNDLNSNITLKPVETKEGMKLLLQKITETYGICEE